MGLLDVSSGTTIKQKRTLLEDETYWLLVFIVICGTLIIGCGCYSFRITKIRLRERSEALKRAPPRHSDGLTEFEFSSFAPINVSCDLSDMSSVASSTGV
ncbi:hypothetical protein M3Y99_00880200 [Aphelenchoides fujianensis]|nr:hypothetical protein M3Y99_00880200 [Aphelenchoides fujianensis]